LDEDEICDRHGILLILDEVMCGMGRTGTLHACEQEGVAPDLMAIAKGLGGGYQPIGAVLASSRIVEAMRGLMVYPMGGTIDGEHGDHVLLAPPFIATPAELDIIVERLAAAIESGTEPAKRAA